MDFMAAAMLLGKGGSSWMWGEEGESIEVELGIHRVNTVLRLVELLLIVMGRVKGDWLVFASLFADRCILSILFLSPESERVTYLGLILLYGIFDTIKYGFLLMPNPPFFLGYLRYNLPLVTNLVLPFLSVSLMSDYIKINAEDIAYEVVNGVRLLQLVYLVHGVMNYRICLQQRR